VTGLARGLSIIGHPLVVMPGAGLAAWVARGGGTAQAAGIAVGSGLAGLLILGYSRWRVRSGAWAHVDASGRGERRNLNRFLLGAFTGGAVAGWALAWPPAVTLALVSGAAMVAAAMLTARWCKASLHMAFAVFAAGLLHAVSAWAVAAALLMTLAIAWSRLHLQRHVSADLWCGAAIGVIAAIAFNGLPGILPP